MSDFEVSPNSINSLPNLYASDGLESESEIFEADCLPEEGTCCFCAGPCNPCSQACGYCIRRPYEIITEYQKKDIFLQELREVYNEVYKVLDDKPTEYLEGGVKRKYNRKKYRRGVDNLKRSLRYFFEAYATTFSEETEASTVVTPPPE